MELNALATKVNALACMIRSLALAIAIVPASLAGTALATDLNQHGLTGTWYDPALSGQGIELEVYQDAIAPGIGTCREVGQPSPSPGTATVSAGTRLADPYTPYTRGKRAGASMSTRTQAGTSTLHPQPGAWTSDSCH